MSDYDEEEVEEEQGQNLGVNRIFIFHCALFFFY